MLESILVIGLMRSGVYAMLAIGFSLIFGVAKILNLSHTAFYMIATYIIYVFSVTLGINPILAILISIGITVVLGMFFYKTIIEPVREHETTVIITTVAIALLLQEVLLLFFGGHYRGVSAIIPGHSTLLGIRVTNQYILTFVVVFVFLAILWYILMKTRLGVAIRSSAQDREIANLMGIDVSKVASITVLIALVLSAVAGAMMAPIYVIEPHMWLDPLIIVLAVVILGGLGSIKGSFIGAFILGFAEVLVVSLVPGGSFLKLAMALALMVVILLIKPEGLFGVSIEGER